MFNLEHVTISVNNIEKTINFYQKFGFKLLKEYHDDKCDILRMSLNDVILEIFHYNNNFPLPKHSENLDIDLKTIGNKHFGLSVKNINKAVEFVKQNISDEEIAIHEGRLGKPYFFIKDPDGILLEIIEE